MMIPTAIDDGKTQHEATRAVDTETPERLRNGYDGRAAKQCVRYQRFFACCSARSTRREELCAVQPAPRGQRLLSPLGGGAALSAGGFSAGAVCAKRTQQAARPAALLRSWLRPTLSARTSPPPCQFSGFVKLTNARSLRPRLEKGLLPRNLGGVPNFVVQGASFVALKLYRIQ